MLVLFNKVINSMIISSLRSAKQKTIQHLVVDFHLDNFRGFSDTKNLTDLPTPIWTIYAYKKSRLGCAVLYIKGILLFSLNSTLPNPIFLH